MPMNYTKLFTLLKERNLMQKDLKDVVSDPTLAKLKKNESVNTKVLSAICAKLQCGVPDIMEYIYDESDCQMQKNMNRSESKE